MEIQPNSPPSPSQCSLFHVEKFVRPTAYKKHILLYGEKRSFKPKVTIQKWKIVPLDFSGSLLDISNIQFQTKSFSAFDLLSEGFFQVSCVSL